MSNLIMERVITNETALADWKVKWGAARTALSILCFWQILIFTTHSARKICIYTLSKRFALSLDRKAAIFTQTCPKTVLLRLTFSLKTQPSGGETFILNAFVYLWQLPQLFITLSNYLIGSTYVWRLDM